MVDHPPITDLVTVINRIAKKTIKVYLEDEEGDRVELKDIIQELLNYVEEKVGSGQEQFCSQILPLLSQTMATSLELVTGYNLAVSLLTDHRVRNGILDGMIVSFLLPKFLQQKGLTIVSEETPISDEEMNSLLRKSAASSVLNYAHEFGLTEEEAIKVLTDTGRLTPEEAEDLTRKS